MILLQRTAKNFGNIDGSSIEPAALSVVAMDQFHTIRLETDFGTVPLVEVFAVSTDLSPHEQFVIIEGDCQSVDGIGTNMKSGSLCVLGSVGDKTGASMSGGDLVISGNARDQLGAGMSDGMIYVAGDCRHSLASPLPGRKLGMRGGDILIAGNVGNRACERIRRGTVFVAGDAGDYCVPQMIAGSVVVMGEIGEEWGGGMRRGSIILGRDYSSTSSASLSEAREFELSFLPLLWRHIVQMQHRAFAILNLAIAMSDTATQRAARRAPAPLRIPSTRWVQRQIADLNCNGRGEILVLRRTSSRMIETA